MGLACLPIRQRGASPRPRPRAVPGWTPAAWRVGRFAATFRRDRGGSVTVQFALVLPALILLSLGTVDLGRALLAYHELSLATFEAGRFAMVHSASSKDPATKARIEALVAARLQTLNPARVTVTHEWGQGRPGDFVTIGLRYPFSFVIPALPAIELGATTTIIIVS